MSSSAKKSLRAVFAANLKALMARRKWTQVHLATKSGVSQRHISNLLRQEHDPGSAQIEAIAAAFDLPGWLLMVPNVPPDVLDSPEIPLVIERYTAHLLSRT